MSVNVFIVIHINLVNALSCLFDIKVIMPWKGFGRLGSSNTESWACNSCVSATQGWPFLRQSIFEYFEPSTSRFNAQDLKDFTTTTSADTRDHAVNTHSTKIFFGSGHMFPAGVYSWTPMAIHHTARKVMLWTICSSFHLALVCISYNHRGNGLVNVDFGKRFLYALRDVTFIRIPRQ